MGDTFVSKVFRHREPKDFSGSGLCSWLGREWLRRPGPADPTVYVMTALNRAGVTDLIDQTFDNIRRGSPR